MKNSIYKDSIIKSATVVRLNVFFAIKTIDSSLEQIYKDKVDLNVDPCLIMASLCS